MLQETKNRAVLKISMPELKYPHDGLEPVLSRDTVKYHYSSHTKKYFDNVNELIKGTVFEKVRSLEDLVAKTTSSEMSSKLSNNVRQAWNHTFYWDCLTPEKLSGKPSKALEAGINSGFGSFDKFKKAFSEQGVAGFGSTWTWLVLKGGKLAIETTQDANRPVAASTPLLVVDFWEHAWYVDFPADKKKYAESVWNIINWNYVSEQFEKAKSK